MMYVRGEAMRQCIIACICTAMLWPTPAVELLFDGSLKNTGALSGEAVFVNPVSGEEAAVVNGVLDLTATKGSFAEKDEAHGGSVQMPVTGFLGASGITISGVFRASIVDDLPRRIVSLKPFIDVYAQGGAVVAAVTGSKDTKWLSTKIAAARGERVFFAVVIDAAQGKVFVYKGTGGLVKTHEDNIPEGVSLRDGIIEIGNLNKSRPWNGTIDSVRVWPIAAGEAELAAVYEKEKKASSAQRTASRILFENFDLLSEASVRGAWRSGITRMNGSARISLAADGAEKCLRMDYRFAECKENPAVNLARKFTPAAISGVSFDMNVSHTGGDIKLHIEDASGQLHQAVVSVKTPNTWQTVFFPFTTEMFRAHYHGANDGKFHFPLKSFRIDMYKGSLADGVDGHYLLKNIALMGAAVTDETSIFLNIENDLPSGVAFIGEKATYRIIAANALDSKRDITCSLYTRTDDGRTNATVWDASLAPFGKAERVFARTMGVPGYTAIRLEAREGGRLLRTEYSGIAAVNKVPNYGKPDPSSFFGTMHVWMDPEANERIGVKNMREFVRLGTMPKKPEDVHWRVFDERIDSAFKRHMQVVICLEPHVTPGLHSPPLPEYKWRTPKELASPENIADWRDFVRLAVTRYKDKAAAVEIGNENDIQMWHFNRYTLAEAAEYYAVLVREAAPIIRSIAPNMFISMNTAGRDFSIPEGHEKSDQPGNFLFTKAVFDKVGTHFDMISSHPYALNAVIGKSAIPQMPDDMPLKGIFQKTLDFMASYGRPRRFWSTELGWQVKVDDVADTQYGLYATITAQANIIAKSVPGVDKLFWFIFSWDSPPEGIGKMNLFNKAASGVYYPTPAAATYAAAAYMLHRTKPVKDISLDPMLTAYRFDSLDEDMTVLALWSKRDGEYIYTAALPSGTTAVNGYGRNIEDIAAIPFNRTPIYIAAKKKDADALERSLSQGRIKAAIPVHIARAYPSSRTEVKVTLENPVDSPITAEVIAGGRTKSVPIAGGKSESLSFAVDASAASFDIDVIADGVRQTRTVSLDLISVASISRPVLDGVLTEIKTLTPMVLNSRAFITPGDAPWNGPDDLSVRAYFAQNSDGLYFAAEVDDSVHFAKDDAAGNFWRSDSVQLAIDYEGDSTIGYDENDREIGFVLGESGSKAYVYRAKPKISIVPLADSFAAKRDGKRTIYEAFIRWKDLGYDAPAPGKVMSLNFIVNENDGQGRAHWMGLTPGIGEAKTPGSYKEFVFSAKQ